MPSRSKDNTLCSFCGKPQNEVKKMIAGPTDIYICDSCVNICKDVIDRELREEEAPSDPPETHVRFNLVKPTEIKAKLDEFIIGQEYSKKVLSVAVYNHYKRLSKEALDSSLGEHDDVEIEKSNVLLIGPTGTGKTLMARTLAKQLQVPFAIADATTLTEAGYVGEDVENIILHLLQAANYDIQKAECGIIYVDEIDKIGRKTENVSITRDVSGEGVQQSLLKIFEGTVCNVPPQGGRKHPNQEYLKVDTTNILFICGGAFVDLDKLVRERVATKVLGFEVDQNSDEKTAKKVENILKEIQPEDLSRYGLIPEFIGRLPIISVLDELTKEDLESILRDTKNSLLKQYAKLLAMEGIKLNFTRNGITAIAEKAITLKTGARALRAIIEKIMLDIMYSLPQIGNVKEVTINRAVVEGRGRPKIKYGRQNAA